MQNLVNFNSLTEDILLKYNSTDSTLNKNSLYFVCIYTALEEKKYQCLLYITNDTEFALN